jgi:DNA-binding NarL/FixJ family response regulator
MPSAIRVLIVEDHQMVAEALAASLAGEPDITVVGVVGTAAAARERARSSAPDVILMDHLLPDGLGTRLVPQIRSQRPSTRVILVTGSDDDPALLVEAIEAGCCGFVVKHKGLRELVGAVRSAHAGDAVISPALLRSLVAGLSHGNGAPLPYGLTTREVEILGMLADGLGNRAIARDLGITLHTVRNHVQAVIHKIGAHSKLEAVSTALRDGAIAPPRDNRQPDPAVPGVGSL